MTIEPIVRDVELTVAPERVYAAYTDLDELRKWFAQDGHMDAQPGGTWRFVWPGNMAAEGRVLEASSPTRFVWTWEKSISPAPDGGEDCLESMVTNTYTFTPKGDGTIFRIEETGHDTEEIRAMNEPGIDGMIETLRAYLEDGTEVTWDNAEMSSSE